MRLSLITEKKGHCPSCGKKFPKGEPYPDVENCETCERFGPPVKESYEDLEDADEFWDEWGETFASLADQIGVSVDLMLRVATQLQNNGQLEGVYWDIIQPNHDVAPEDQETLTGAAISALEDQEYDLTESYENLEDADEFEDDHDDYDDDWYCTECGSETVSTCDACADPLCDGCAIHSDFGDTLCPVCGETVTESYEHLEDQDEFLPEPPDQGHPPDPMFNEIDYQFLGNKSGHQFDYKGDTYLVTGYLRGGDVFKNGELIGKSKDEANLEDFMWNGQGEFYPAQSMTWDEITELLYNVLGPDDYGDPPPGVGI